MIFIGSIGYFRHGEPCEASVHVSVQSGVTRTILYIVKVAIKPIFTGQSAGKVVSF